ncbi:MAG: glycosyltransferase family 2 protein [Anaerolineae bacterium]|nr:glycosyltransferase family 2 protein [Anaerolineae bacterium]
MAKPRVVVVMPAYNAAKTIERTYNDIPLDVVDHIIVVDDVSHDETVEIARKLGLQTIIHIQNKGYGGNQKTCYIEALKAGAEVIVMLHPDYQYDSTLVPELIRPILGGQADMMLGSRLLGNPRAGGMPLYKYIANRFLTICENVVLRQHLSEGHTGFRAYSRKLLSTVPFVLNADDFVFDTEMIVQAAAFGFRIGEIPVPTRYFDEASSINFKRSMVYGVRTLWTLARYLLDRANLLRTDQFRKPLRQMLSHYLIPEILGNDT